MRVTFSPKPLVFLFAICLASTSLLAQLGVGTQQIDPSAMLEVYSDTSGVLLPRMTAAQRDAINNPAEGLLLMCTDCNDSVLYVFFQGGWTPFSTQTNSSGLLKDQKGNIYAAHEGLYMPSSNSNNLVLGDSVLQNFQDPNFNGLGLGDNVIVGNGASKDMEYGHLNTIVGSQALEKGNGSLNVVIGAEALSQYSSLMDKNTAIGTYAGQNAKVSNSVFIGHQAGKDAEDNNSLYIANSGTQTPLIGGRFNGKRLGINQPMDSLGGGATLQVGGDLSLQNGVAVSEFSSDASLSDSSSTSLPTEAAVKAYVDQSTNRLSAQLNTNSALGGIIIKDDNDNMYTYHDSIDLSGLYDQNRRNLTLGMNAFNLAGGAAADNIGIGHNVMPIETSLLKDNLIIGNNAGVQVKSGSNRLVGFEQNTVLGNYSMSSYGYWHRNVAIGYKTLKGNDSTNQGAIYSNVAVGAYAGENAASSYNTFIGSEAGNTTTTEKNVHLGYTAGKNENTYSNTLYITNSETETPLIGGAFDKGNAGIGKSIAELQDGANFQVAGDISVAEGADINEFSTDVHLSDSSFTALPTEGAVKAYVDSTRSLIKDQNFNVYSSLDPLNNLSTGNRNFALGHNTLKNNASGNDNIAIGYNTLDSSTYSTNSILIGTEAGKEGHYFEQSIAIGGNALSFLSESSNNIAIGYKALEAVDDDFVQSLGNNLENTIAIGNSAGQSSSSNSIFIGNGAGSNINGSGSGVLFIANSGGNTPLIGGKFEDKKVGINRNINQLSSGATLQVGGDISVAQGADINEFSTDVSLNDSSFIAIPTEGAVKGYVDNLTDNLMDDLTNDLPRLSVHANGSNNNHTNLDNFDALLTTSQRNIAIGQNALKSFQDGNNNLGLGHSSLANLSQGDDNVSLGNWGLTKLSSGDRNLSVGTSALRDLNTGSQNVAVGRQSASNLIDGSVNTALGSQSLGLAQDASNNVAIGTRTLFNTDGNYNTALGFESGKNADGSSNVFIGSYAGSASSGSDLLYVENSNTNIPLIGGNFSKNTVGINRDITDLNAGHTLQVNGTISSNTGVIYGHSDKRLKKNVERLQSEEMLNKVLQMQGVTYEWNDTVTGYDRVSGTQHGFIAQSLQEVWPTKVEEDALGYLNTSYGTYDPMFVESIKALYAKIENLESENQGLRTKAELQKTEQDQKIEALLQRMTQLEQQLEKENNATTLAALKK